MKTVLAGVLAEFIAIGCGYAILSQWHRMPIYALFYLPVVDNLLQPMVGKVPTVNNSMAMTLLAVILVLVNSVKWIYAFRLMTGKWKLLGWIVTLFLVVAVFCSISEDHFVPFSK